MCIHTSAHDSLPCVHVFAREPNKPNSTPMINTHKYKYTAFPYGLKAQYAHIYTHTEGKKLLALKLNGDPTDKECQKKEGS